VTNDSRGAFSDSFYYRAIQTKIGEALRTRLVPTEPASDQILNALQELDHQQEDHEAKEKQDGPTREPPDGKGDNAAPDRDRAEGQ
jgi:hypothetical protein